MKRMLFPVVTLLLSACGGGGGESTQDHAGERLLPTSQIELVVQMQSPPPRLLRHLADFAETNAVELRLDESGEERPALVELSSSQLSEWIHSDRLAPLPAALEEQARHAWGAEGATWDGRLMALPWRVRPFALVLAGEVEAPEDWPGLQAFERAHGAWASDEASLLPTFLSLFASSTGPNTFTAAPAMDGDAWSETLSFLTRSVALEQLCTAEELERRFVSGEAAIIPADPGRWSRLRALQPQRPLTLMAFPPLDALVGEQRSAIEPRFLAFPRTGAYPDLAVALARELYTTAGEFVVAEEQGFLPANPDVLGDTGDAVRWRAVLERGVAPAAFARRAEWESALSHAIRQSIDRKRNPAQALSEAQTIFGSGQDQ